MGGVGRVGGGRREWWGGERGGAARAGWEQGWMGCAWRGSGQPTAVLLRAPLPPLPSAAEDGGATWKRERSADSLDANLYELIFTPAGLGFVLGNNGILLRVGGWGRACGARWAGRVLCRGTLMQRRVELLPDRPALLPFQPPVARCSASTRLELGAWILHERLRGRGGKRC